MSLSPRDLLPRLTAFLMIGASIASLVVFFISPVFAEHRNTIILGIGAIVTLILLIQLRDRNFRGALSEALFEIAHRISSLIGGFTGIGAAITIDDSFTREQKRKIDYLQSEISALRDSSQLGSNSALLESTAKKAVSAALDREIARDIAKSVEENFQSALQDVFDGRVDGILDDRRRRLERTATVVTVRGFFNLMFGLIFAGVGIWYLISRQWDLTEVTIESLTLFALTRLSISILCVVVAYFFFSLYRSSLDDTKYYQNEISNVDSLHVAILTLSILDQDGRLDLAKSFSLKDSNAPLEKGQLLRGDTSRSYDMNLVRDLLKKIPNKT